jgi:hypothetical protein
MLAKCYFSLNGSEGEETDMHKVNAIVVIALAFVLAGSGTALAYKKKASTPKQIAPKENITFTYTKAQFIYSPQQRSNNPCRKCN